MPVWDKYWNKLVSESKAKRKPVSVGWALCYTFGPTYLISSLFLLGYSVLQFASPAIVNLLIDFVNSDDPLWKGLFYTVLICVVTFFNTILNNMSFFVEYQVGLRLKSALISAIYKKSVKLSNTGRKEMTGLSIAACLPVSLHV